MFTILLLKKNFRSSYLHLFELWGVASGWCVSCKIQNPWWLLYRRYCANLIARAVMVLSTANLLRNLCLQCWVSSASVFSDLKVQYKSVIITQKLWISCDTWSVFRLFCFEQWHCLSCCGRNDVWRYQGWSGPFGSWRITIFRGFSLAAVAMVVTIAADKMFGLKRDLHLPHHATHSDHHEDFIDEWQMYCYDTCVSLWQFFQFKNSVMLLSVQIIRRLRNMLDCLINSYVTTVILVFSRNLTFLSVSGCEVKSTLGFSSLCFLLYITWQRE